MVNKIDTITAFITEDDDGDEGIVGAKLGNGWMPLIGADEERIASLSHIAKEVANTTGQIIKLVRFSQKEVIGFIAPDGTFSEGSVQKEEE